MSFSLSVKAVPQDGASIQELFEGEVMAGKVTPKIDGRTKLGKAQVALVEVAKELLCNGVWEIPGLDDATSVIAGTISGHASAPDVYSVSVGFNVSKVPAA